MVQNNVETKQKEPLKEKSGVDKEPKVEATSEQLGCVDSVCQTLGINKNLIFLKMTLFVMYGATASLLPYLTIHMQSIGLTVEDMAIVYLALPLTTFLAPPVTGMLVDKFGSFKPVVIGSLLLNLGFHHSLLFIPHQESPGMMPAAYVVRHPSTGKVEVWWSPCPSRECPEEEEIDMVVDDCEDYCLIEMEKPRKKYPVLPSNIAVMPPTLIGMKNPNSFSGVQLGGEEKKKKPASNKVEVNIKENEGGKILIYPEKSPSVNATKEDLHFIKPGGKKNQNSTIIHKHRKQKKKKPRKNGSDDKNRNMSDIHGGVAGEESSEEDPAFFFVDMHPNLGDPIEQLGMEVDMDDDNETVTDFRTRFGPNLLLEYGVNVTVLDEFDLRCGGMVLATNLTLERLKDLAADCMLQKCNFREGGPEVCPPEYEESDDRIFWIYFLLRFIGTTMLSGCVTIMDPIALAMIQQFGGEFGRERLFSSVGMAIFSPLTGVLIDYYSQGKGYTDYSAAFYTYDILLLISLVSICLMPLAPKLPADNIFKDMVAIIKMPHVLLFILFMFLLGNFWGFIESYAFLYLKELGASNYLLGITVTVGTISSVPFLWGAEKLTQRFGHVNIIVVAFLSHAMRLMGYSFIEEPYWCFPFEAMEALAIHLMWVAAATYCALLAPKNLLATLIGVLGMAHFSLGKGSGSFVGGMLIGTIGTRKSFRVMGIVAVCGGVAYYILHYAWLRKLPAVKEIEAMYKHAETTEPDAENNPEPKPLTRDVSISTQRLSLMIEFHHRGSLASLDRSGKDINAYRGSASKMDLLRSATDINNRRNSNPSLALKISTSSLGRQGSLSRDKILRDSYSNITPQFSKRSTSSIYETTPLQGRRDSVTIFEEEELVLNKTNQDNIIAERTT